MYLTYDEFKSLGISDISEDNFKKAITKAEIQIDMVTNFFYADGSHDLQNDLISPKKRLNMRAKAFKRALGIIICYAIETGVSSFNDAISGNVKSISIGRTHLDTSGTASVTYGKSAVPKEAMALLFRWGFLYKGVDYR
ncbi:hypothetical protein GBO97_07615 [Pediococcus acidilactici]|uniref:hypothetical protein n=1 Tax=Pediococcus acidilactici TaxID=1254 RepID=UPI001330B411|nr:hypothetical protein [Pediococcus acidilactici]KAF0353801.1 hypothetical protein GBO47_07625 [Pediococcus acidilactici]KAF0358139.1 hypothetical protein GBO51_07610 [Pediococcus acidilactici]KAF0447008.1 hypothetical protein GBO97_07615 [Pediococcus acidilactici]KAF0557340.1 hypothetical protein GBP47_07585 [Pediococcus acidilactici]